MTNPPSNVAPMFSSNTFKDAAERAIAAVCQTFIALVGTDGAGVVSIDLLDAAQASLVAGVLSIVKSYAAVKGPIGGPNPSMVNLDDEA